MNRRTFLSSLLALPVVGRVLVSRPETTITMKPGTAFIDHRAWYWLDGREIPMDASREYTVGYCHVEDIS